MKCLVSYFVSWYPAPMKDIDNILPLALVKNGTVYKFYSPHRSFLGCSKSRGRSVTVFDIQKTCEGYSLKLNIGSTTIIASSVDYGTNWYLKEN